MIWLCAGTWLSVTMGWDFLNVLPILMMFERTFRANASKWPISGVECLLLSFGFWPSWSIYYLSPMSDSYSGININIKDVIDVFAFCEVLAVREPKMMYFLYYGMWWVIFFVLFLIMHQPSHHSNNCVQFKIHGWIKIWSIDGHIFLYVTIAQTISKWTWIKRIIWLREWGTIN